MSWRELPVARDEETELMIEIAEDFLVSEFAHDRSTASQMLEDFLTAHSDKYDEVTIHRQMAYRMAAFVHFVMAMKGRYEDAYAWLLASQYNDTPAAAESYMRRKYFSPNDDSSESES